MIGIFNLWFEKNFQELPNVCFILPMSQFLSVRTDLNLGN